MRKWPIYILLDISTSESEVYEQLISLLLNQLRRDPYALEVAYLSVIVFGVAPTQILPLVELSSFKLETPFQSVSTLTDALSLLSERIHSETNVGTSEIQGFFSVSVLIFTHSIPDRAWSQRTSDYLNSVPKQDIALCICGSASEFDSWDKLTNQVINLDVVSLQDAFDAIKKHLISYKWVEDEISSGTK